MPSTIYTDPESELVKLRNLAERMVDKLVLDKFHLLRRLENSAAHGETIRPMDALRALHEAWQLARGVHVSLTGGKVEDFGSYKEPPTKGIDSKAAIKREKKRLAEENSAKEIQIKAMLAELEALRASEAAQRAVIGKANSPLPKEKIEPFALQIQASVRQLHFLEDKTREYMVDRDLALVGWSVPTAAKLNPAVGLEVEVQHQGTETGIGYPDYVLWDDNGNSRPSCKR